MLVLASHKQPRALLQLTFKSRVLPRRLKSQPYEALIGQRRDNVSTMDMKYIKDVEMFELTMTLKKY